VSPFHPLYYNCTLASHLPIDRVRVHRARRIFRLRPRYRKDPRRSRTAHSPGPIRARPASYSRHVDLQFEILMFITPLQDIGPHAVLPFIPCTKGWWNFGSSRHVIHLLDPPRLTPFFRFVGHPLVEKRRSWNCSMPISSHKILKLS
jgi:hypothetical protein